METSASSGLLPAYHSAESSGAGRWVAGGVGTIMAICAIVFVILGCVQPDWFVRSIGSIGTPHSWPLWTIAGGGLIVSGLLIAYAICSRGSKIEVSGEPTSLKEEVVSEFQISSYASPLIKASFHAKLTFNELFADEGELLNAIPDYQGQFPSDGRVDLALMTNSVVKGCIQECSDIPFMIFKIQCVGSDIRIGNYLGEKFDHLHPSELPTWIEEAKRPTLLLFIRDRIRWKQWWTPPRKNKEYSSTLMPSFIDDYKGGSIGVACIGPEDEADIQRQEAGFANLKRLMKGEIVEDHNGLKWQLAPENA